jgi:CHAD domain-containing protein
MGASTTTFRAAAPDGGPPWWLRDHFDVSEAADVTVTVLDTFDGRLASAGLRLVALAERGDGGSGTTVTLGGPGAVAVTVRGPALPRTAGDVPVGPLRSRLAALLGVRVLIPRFTVDASRAVAERRDDSGKVVAAVTTLQPEGTAELYVTVTPLVGYEQAATEAATALARHLDTEPIDGDAIDVMALERGLDLGSAAVEPGIPLDADMPAIDGVRAVLANLRDAVAANRPGAVASLDPEFLHDVRVAVRRTRAVLRHVKSVLPRHVYERTRDDFAWLGEITGPVRDLDVYQIEWPTYVDGLDDAAVERLERVRAVLADRLEEARARLARELGGPPADAVLARWSSWLDAEHDDAEHAGDEHAGAEHAGDAAEGPKAQRPLGRFVAKRIRHAHRRMIERGRALDEASPDEELHELRKDAKKLRYLIECFGGLYEAERRKAFVKRLKQLQDNLGEHQDAAVHAAQLRALVGESSLDLPAETVLAAGQLVERMEQRRRTTRDEFAERFEAFDSKPTRKALSALLDSAEASS